MPFEWLNTHLVLPSYWQSKEGVCDLLYENSFATVQPEIWQFGIAINTMSYFFTHTCRISPGAIVEIEDTTYLAWPPSILKRIVRSSVSFFLVRCSLTMSTLSAMVAPVIICDIVLIRCAI